MRKIPFKFLLENNFEINISDDEMEKFNVKQQDNQLFRQIRIITGDNSDYNKYITFVDCKGGKIYEDELSRLILRGYKLKSQDFVISERSASMVRTSILSFVDKSIAEQLDEIVSMGIKVSKTVLSKLYAYRGLMLSSCHCLENWYPKIIIVPDYYREIPNQHIKYVYDKEIEFTDKNGQKRKWKQKDIAETTRDIKINVFDGCGVHHPEITKIVKEKLNSETNPTSILWRAPYIKGVTHEIDYVAFFEERGIRYIYDVWGEKHDIYSEPMIIMTESMYKGKKYFHNKGTIEDWQDYWDRFKKYNHCIGVAKWNFSKEEEPLYTRSSYQILQDLDLPYEKFAKLAKYSVDWVEKIVSGDRLYTYCFLGLFADKHKSLNNYTKAVLKNPEMLKEHGVRKYLISLVNKYKDEMKAGKLWLNATFKFLVPDLIMLLEHIGGLEPNGCLDNDEFYSSDINGVFEGEYLIERNPHICKSEHVILNAINNVLINKYCSNLANICMINGKSITPQRLNGADYDGDLVLVIKNEIMMKGVDRNTAIVMDIDDKITSLEEEDTPENKVKVILRGMHSLIGETSNCATSYHNKQPKTKEQKVKYESYIDLLSVINGKAIDAAKTGVIFNIPRHIAKYSKPLPYFMKYAGDYYAKMRKFSKANSNMNRLCFELEKWDKQLKWKKDNADFDYRIMIDDSLEIPEDIFIEIEKIYLDYCKEINQLIKDDKSIKQEYKDIEINWDYYYDSYRKKCYEICNDEKLIANIAVKLCYEKYPKKNKGFMWIICGNGIVKNIKQCETLFLPQKDSNGVYEYLGKRYNLVEVNMKEESNG